MDALPPLERARLVAATGIIARTGARDFEVGYDPNDENRWYAQACWPNRSKPYRFGGFPDPIAATEALMFDVCEGGTCTWCSRPASFLPTEGVCQLQLHGDAYIRACRDDRDPSAPPPSWSVLANDLVKAGLPPEFCALAARGHYSDYNSPLDLPTMALVEDLTAVGKQTGIDVSDLVEQVKAGKYDATKAESDAWAASPEGREAMAAFGHLFSKPSGPNRAQRRASARKQKRK